MLCFAAPKHHSSKAQSVLLRVRAGWRLVPTTSPADNLTHLETGIYSATRSSFKSRQLPKQGLSLRSFSLTDHLLFLLLLWILVSSKTRLPPQHMSNLPRGQPGSQRPACYCQLLHVVQSCARHFLFLSVLFCTNTDTWGSSTCSAQPKERLGMVVAPWDAQNRDISTASLAAVPSSPASCSSLLQCHKNFNRAPR